jgi:arginine/ornithine N-succinyltransferase beta subunit
MDKGEIAAKYVDFLKAEGYLPEVDESGHVHFKREGITYYILIDATDPAYLRLWLPNFWRAADDASRREALDALNTVHAQIKVAKVVMDKDGHASSYVEIFASGPEEAARLLPRCASAALGAARSFLEKVEP